MAKEFKLTDSQVTLLKDAQILLAKAREEATRTYQEAQLREKALQDLLTMFCESKGLDKLKTEFNLDTQTAVEKSD